MRNYFLLTILLFTSFIFGQNGTVSGVILDKEYNNEPLPFANVVIKGTTIGTSTDDKGKYTLSVKPGSYVLEIGYLGYETKQIPFTIKAGEKKVIDYTLAADGVQLADVVITHTVTKESEQALLQEQQQSVEIKQSIGAQELSKKGVGDVAAAVIKTSGVAKQEGSGNIYVRGLGDRYNSTSMNGLPIPSNDPEKKNIDLGIFPTDIVEYVSIDKVYNSKIYGDFAGGNIDIASKDYNGSGFLAMGIKSAANTNAISNRNFRLQDGPSFLGFHNSSSPSNPLGSYNFENSLNPQKKYPLATGFNVTGGEKIKFNDEANLSIFSTVSFDNEFTSISDGFAKVINIKGTTFKDFKEYESFKYNTNTTALLNLGLKINSDHKIKFNTVYINTSSQGLREYKGKDVNTVGDDDDALIRRSDYTKNTLWINQLLGEHKYKERLSLNWGGSFNQVTSDSPDRITNTLRTADNGLTYKLNKNSASDNQRYFQKLTEDEIAVSAVIDYKFSKVKDETFNGKISLGYNGKYKTRDFEAIQYNFKINGSAPNSASETIIDPNNIDGFFNQQNFQANYFTILTYNGGIDEPNALDPQTYSGKQIISSAIGSIQYKFSEKLFVVAGLRSDQIYQNVKWKTQIDPKGDKNYFTKMGILPNLTAKYALNDKQNLRLGASKTYTLPQFKETALFIYEDITQQKFGNPYLYPSDNYNFDLKWELFPAKEAVIAATGFGKYIVNPINEIVLLSSSNDFSYANTGAWGTAVGLEIEGKGNLYQVESESSTEKISAGINVSYMKSNQELDGEKVNRETQGSYNIEFAKKEINFTGAANFLVNADISFIKEWNKSEQNFMATIAYSTNSDKLYAIGNINIGNIIEKPVHLVDLILKSKLTENISLGFSAKNLINPKYKLAQEINDGEEIVLQSFKKGRNFSLSLNYQF